MPDDATELPIDGTLDLHTFRPQDTGELLDAYFEACLERGIHEVRVVHGKGTGTLRRTVESHLGRDPRVLRWAPGGFTGGGWGATVVTLRVPRK
ncbi:MAG: Smr/MutS family protein [Opitutales bacterium]